MSDYQEPTTSSKTLQRSASPPGQFLGSPNEVCIVTPDLKKTLSALLKTGIASSFKIFHFTPGTVTEQTFNGQPASFALDVAFSAKPSDNGITWEVMQPVGEARTLMKEFLDRNGGREGVQHIAFDCDVKQSGTGNGVGEEAREEARRRKGEFEERGFPCVMSGLWKGRKGTCEFMFFDTEGAEVGTCFETYVFSDDWEEPEDVDVFPAGSA